MNSPWHALVDPHRFDQQVDRIERLGATVIATSHSPVITGANVADAHRKIRRVAGGDATPLPSQAELDAMRAALAPALALAVD
jgi:hypothetical protein